MHQEPQSWAAVQLHMKSLGKQRQWQSLWYMIPTLPIPQAVAAAKHLKLSKWRPPGDADVALAKLLAEADQGVVSKAAASVFEAATQIIQKPTVALSPAAFAYHEPVVALNLVGRDPSMSEIVTVDRTGIRAKLYEGPASHWSMCCLDTTTVVARREFAGGWRGDTEVVEYTEQGEQVLASGAGLLDGKVRATASGFVLGIKMSPIAFAVADGAQRELDLSRHGLRRSDVLAVDATGTKIAFADGNRMLLTDNRLQPQHELVIKSVREDYINTVAFTTDSIITAEYERGLRRWMIIGDRIRAVETIGRPPRAIFTLSPVTAWNLVVGEAGNENFFFDIATLERVQTPQFLGDDSRRIGTFVAEAHSRFAVYQGNVFAIPEQDPHNWYKTVVHDLGHPLNTLAKPILSLTAADAEALRDLTKSGHSPHDLSETAREALDVVRKAAELRPSLETA